MRLPLPWLLALRYLKSGRRDAYVSFLSVLATGGVTLGVAALIWVLAGLSGLQSFLRSDVLARTPHIEVEAPAEVDASGLASQLALIDGVEAAQRILRGRGWLLAGGSAVSVRAVGYEHHVPRFFPLNPPLQDEESPPTVAPAPARGLIIGDALARRWALEIGDVLDIVSPRPSLTPFGPQPRVHRLGLAGTFHTGQTEDDDHRIALPLETALRLFGDQEQVIEIQTSSLDDALVVAERVRAVAPSGSNVRTWQELNRALFFALKLEKTLMFVAVFLIVPVAGMALITVLALLISSKRSEIGMLQAMGAEAADLRRAFLLLGGLLGLLGLLVGGTLGVVGAYLLDRYRLIAPPGDIYFLDHIPFVVEGGDLLAILGATIALIATSTIYAARRAAATSPIEALRG